MRKVNYPLFEKLLFFFDIEYFFQTEEKIGKLIDFKNLLILRKR